MTSRQGSSDLVASIGLIIAIAIASVIAVVIGRWVGDSSAAGVVAYPAGLVAWTLIFRPDWLPGGSTVGRLVVAAGIIVVVVAIAVVLAAVAP